MNGVGAGIWELSDTKSCQLQRTYFPHHRGSPHYENFSSRHDERFNNCTVVIETVVCGLKEQK